MLEAIIYGNMGTRGKMLVDKLRDDGEVHYMVGINADLDEAEMTELINNLMEIRYADTLIEEPKTAQAG